jgi:hypothetical protein
MSAFNSLLTMPQRQRNVLSWALPVVIITRFALWILPVKFLIQQLRRTRRDRPRFDSRPEVRTLIWAVEAVSRRIPGGTCLSRALAAHVLLAKYGYPSEICLGVARANDDFRAHAWLEHDGEVVMGHSEESYTRLPELRSP